MPTQSSQATAEGMPIDRAQRIKSTAEQLAKSVKAGNVNPDYDFTNHDAIWQCMRLRSGVKLTEVEAVAAFNAAMGINESELPVERVNRLSRELSEALGEWMDGEFMAVILPATRGNGYPIMFGNIDNQKEAIAHQAGRAL